MLKEIFTGLVVQGEFPDLGWMEFAQFCQDSKLVDENCNLAKLDLYFIATNVELEEQDGNSDSSLCRFEFFEILIRIAKGKYVDSGKCKTYEQALRLLLNLFILPMKDKVEPW